MRGRVVLAAIVVLGVGAGVWWWFSRGRTVAWRPALTSREIALRVLGEHLAQRYPGAKALVIGNPFTQRSGQAAEIYAFEEASLRGLEQGFHSPAAIQVVYPDLRPEFLERPGSVYIDPKTTTPLSYLVAEGSFEKLLEAHPEHSLVVSLIGLPVRIRESRVWTSAPERRFALVMPDWRMVGGMESVRQAFRRGTIAAAVVVRPGAPAEEPPSRTEYRPAFESRFLLVTPENIDQLLESHPQLF